MATKKKTKGEEKNALFIGAAVAGAAAAAAGYYFYGPKGKQHRQTIKSWTLKAQGEVMDKVERLKEIDRESFNKAVDQVAGKYQKAKGLAASEVASFAKEVKEQWKHVENEFEKGAKTGKKAVKRTVKKGSKKAAAKKK